MGEIGQDNMPVSKQCAGGKSDVDAGDLIVGDRLNFAKLRGGEANRGIEDIGAGTHSQLELTQLGLVRPAGEDRFVARGEDSLPVLGELIDGIEDFLGDGRPSLFAGAEALKSFEDGPMDARLGCGVSDGNLGSQAN